MELSGEIGKYKIIRKLGSGGFGTVYLAEDKYLKTLRALKIPHRTGAQMEKILTESVLQCRLLDHPNIVKLLTVDVISNTIIMVMEYVRGTDLEQLIDRQEQLEISVAVDYFRQILSALEYAHSQNIVHRDIRPSNILIDEQNRAKITDFGTSASVAERPYATTRIGSPPYMSPEQFEGRAVLASDLYSAGCIFYEMATGFPPVVLANPLEIYRTIKSGEIPPLSQKRPDIPKNLEAIVMRALEPDRNRRYRHASEILQDLDHMDQDPGSEPALMEDIQLRIQARNQRTDQLCWNCRKAMPRPSKTCPYCGAEQL